MSSPTLLIDADILLHRAVSIQTSVEDFAFEIDCDGGEPASPVLSLRQAKRLIDTEVAKWKEEFETDTALLCLSDSRNWRKVIMPEYKAQRPPKPEGYEILVEYVKEHYNYLQTEWLEADDVIGKLVTSETANEFVVVSRDKDFNGVPGIRLYDPDRMVLDRYGALPGLADRFHLMQTLAGDRVDNYFGVPGIGEKKAWKIIEQDCSWKHVVHVYEANGLTEEDALLNARVARILRFKDHDQDRIRLWCPTPEFTSYPDPEWNSGSPSLTIGVTNEPQLKL